MGASRPKSSIPSRPGVGIWVTASETRTHGFIQESHGYVLNNDDELNILGGNSKDQRCNCVWA
jgi:hypothetical protein